MAKQRSGSSENSKMTVLIFQLEGDNKTLQDGFQTISMALNKMIPYRQTKLIANTASTPQEDKILDEEENDTESELTGTQKQREKRKRFYKNPKVVDIDLTSGEMPLQQFLESCPTDDTTKRYLLVAYWLKENRSIEDVDCDHLYTCFRHMGWNAPKDILQPFRDMKSKMGWFHKGSSNGSYRINHLGENEVNKMRQKQ